MQENRTEIYASRLSRLIQAETISGKHQSDRSKFYRFHDLLRELFPALFQVCDFEDYMAAFCCDGEENPTLNLLC